MVDFNSTPDHNGTIDVNPGGDVILDVVGYHGSSILIRVSSKALSQASPVFNAMFSSKFGGVNLGSKPVEFPEDNLGPLTLLLKIIQGRVDPSLEQLGFGTSRNLAHCDDELNKFQGLAIVSNKYFCGRTISKWAASCFGYLINGTTNSGALARAALLAYASGSPQAF
ncbi:hypothetical protein FGG08_006549 [Glutinoglossum americanum]|uniref:BTB domain-containing protein n=1 Tax=Glutinoglossum americanum TaxID=1670608 RepID=A0A9P8KUV3_9PEZI|nr:hypothetical protein FGG08_006549 [Glutinoglossum americanum]